MHRCVTCSGGVSIPRRRVAQAGAAAAVVTMFLPWQTVAEEGGSATPGVEVGEGRIVFIVCLVTIGLIQVRWRPAWIGTGFSCAIMVREILQLSGGGEPDPAFGLWMAVAACAAAAVLLIWEMFAGVSASGTDDKPPGHGLSGPLGRRRR